MLIYGIDIPLDSVKPEAAPGARFAPTEPPADYAFGFDHPLSPDEDEDS